MNDQGLVIRELQRAIAADEEVVLASIVRTAGSAYRGVGTRMIVRADDSATGLVSGGCLEADLIARAAVARSDHRTQLVTYDSRSDDDLVWGLGLGCDGMVQVLLEPLGVPAAQQLARLLQTAYQRRERSVLATVIGPDSQSTTERGARLLMDDAGSPLVQFGEWGGNGRIAAVLANVDAALLAGRRGTVCDADGVEVAMEVAVPPLDLVICGSGPDAVPVATLGAAQGWSVTIVDHTLHAHPERFTSATVVQCESPEQLEKCVALGDRSAIVVMSHHYPRDLEYVGAALKSQAPYIGVLGPRRRTERMLGDLTARGQSIDDVVLDRLHAPIGLDIGGDGPEAIALSIVAEICAVTNGRSAGSLRDRDAPIHDAVALQSFA